MMRSLQLVAASLTVVSAATVRTLYQNDLSATPAVGALIVAPASGNNITEACAAFNETPLNGIPDDVQSQIAYLRYSGQIAASVYLGLGAFFANGTSVAPGGQNFTGCPAFAVGTGYIATPNCSTITAVLCTNSAPVTRPGGINVTSGSLVTASRNGTSFNGYRDARSFRFLGIPFAAPPVGSLRFLGAQPYNGSYSNVPATAFKSICIQNPSASYGTNPSEDCLYLNVYTPVVPSTDGAPASGNTTGLPVAVYIYGGAFVSGAGSSPVYDGGNLVSRGGVVVVTLNYRLGLLGFMASQNLAGSQGITDQILALRWVQQNIATFGGSPQNVTIFGESAGAQSVVALMSSTQAKGLFQKAISQSAPWNPFLNRNVYTSGIYPALLNATNCASGDAAAQLACLQAVPASAFISSNITSKTTAASNVAQKAYSGVGLLSSTVEAVLPVVGTGIVDGLWNELLSAGTLPSAGIDLMIGNMEDEGTLFVDSVPQLQSPVPYLDPILQAILPAAFDNATINAINSNNMTFMPNRSNPDALRAFAGQLVTLVTWQCPTQAQLGIAYSQNTFKSLYSYRFDRGGATNTSGLPLACTPSAPSGYDAVCHSEDVPIVFGTSNVVPFQFDQTNSLAFTQYTVDVWTSFIRTGNPNPAPQYLAVRGRGYNTTASYVQNAAFNAFNPNSTSAIHIMDTPPRNAALLWQQQCQVLANAGFNYQVVGNSSLRSAQLARADFDDEARAASLHINLGHAGGELFEL